MVFLGILVGVFLALSLPGARRLPGLARAADRAAVGLAAGFLFTGTFHFLTPERFVSMIPPALPWPLALVYLSGALEVAGAFGLLVPRFRRAAAWGLALLLLLVFPANVYVAVSGGSVEGLPAAGWYYWARLPLQAVYVAWAVWVGRYATTRPASTLITRSGSAGIESGQVSV